MSKFRLTPRQAAAYKAIVAYGRPITQYHAKLGLLISYPTFAALVDKKFLKLSGWEADGKTSLWTPTSPTATDAKSANLIISDTGAIVGSTEATPQSDGYRQLFDALVNPPTDGVKPDDYVFGASTKLVAKVYDNTPPAGWVTLFDGDGTPWGYSDFDDKRSYGYISGGYATTLVDASRIPGFTPWVSTLGVNIDDRRKIDALRLILNHAFDWAHGGA